MSEISLALTTKIKPAKKFTVDEAEYQLLGMDHLSPNDENEVMALFARHALLLGEQEATVNVLKGKSVAERVRSTRIAIICKLTDLPKDIASKLPLGQQAKLLETLQAEINSDETDEGDGSKVGGDDLDADVLD